MLLSVFSPAVDTSMAGDDGKGSTEPPFLGIRRRVRRRDLRDDFRVFFAI